MNATPDETSEALARACHEIINAASALLVNLEYLADVAGEGHEEAVSDAQRSVVKIVRLARFVRRPPSGEPDDLATDHAAE